MIFHFSLMGYQFFGFFNNRNPRIKVLSHFVSLRLLQGLFYGCLPPPIAIHLAGIKCLYFALTGGYQCRSSKHPLQAPQELHVSKPCIKAPHFAYKSGIALKSSKTGISSSSHFRASKHPLQASQEQAYQ